MATFEELATLPGSPGWDDLRHKITVAAAIKAVALAGGTPTDGEIAWAKTFLSSPQDQADQIIHYVVADSATALVAEILGATDAQIQTAVDSAIDKLLGK